MAKLSKTVRETIPFIIHQNEAPMNKREIREAYVALEGCSSEHDFGTNKDTWSKLKSAIHGAAPSLVKNGILFKPSKGKFDLVQGATIPSAFVQFLSENPVQETQETQEVSQEVQKPKKTKRLKRVKKKVKKTQETTEQEVSQEVSPVVVETTSTLNTLEEEAPETTPTTSVVETTSTLNTQEEEVQEEEVQETQPTTSVVETTSTLLNTLEEVEESNDEVEEEEDVSYDLKLLRSKSRFDPVEVTLKDNKGGKFSRLYECWRDKDNRRVVITQEGRSDYVVVNLNAVSNIEEVYQDEQLEYVNKFIEKVNHQFDTAKNHKNGTFSLCQALASCSHYCQHIDELGGFTDDCHNDLCPIKVVYAQGAIYVEAS